MTAARDTTGRTVRVMKFGGTSVGTAEAIRRTTGIILDERLRGPVVVVVSALGGVTDRLIRVAEDARDRVREPKVMLRELRDLHEEVCRELGLDAAELLTPLAQLREVVFGISSLRELTPRSLDFVLSHGELLSSRIVAANLEKSGMAARAVPGWEAGILTDQNHGEAAILEETWSLVPTQLDDLAERLPVVTGFLGCTRDGERTTLGRGGSDYTAAILGRALGASEILIWTDVSGILSTDPRVVDAATTLPELTFEEAAELAFFGAKVIHPKTIEPAVQSGIPVRVLNTFEPKHPGTSIVGGRRETHRDVVAIAMKPGNILLSLDSTRMLEAEGYLATVFGVLKQHSISVDAIATSEVSVCMTVEERYAQRLEAAAHELGQVAHVELRSGRTIICAVGLGMRDKPGTAARVFGAVYQAGINVEMISMGSSRINVTFVVKDEDAATAVRGLHRALCEG